MKIGILTYHSVANFGANLQTLSTYKFLESKGYDPIVIDFISNTLDLKFREVVPKEQIDAHKNFIHKNVNLTEQCSNSKDISNQIKANDIQGVIIGSDAVLQHFPFLSRIILKPSRKKILLIKLKPVQYETNFPNPFWGEFIDSIDSIIKLVMMSVSCQNTDYNLFPLTVKNKMYRYLNRFDYISVRDYRTMKMLKYISKNRIIPKITPDPVFAFNQNIKTVPSRENIISKFGLKDKYILFSFNYQKLFDQAWLNEFQNIAHINGFECVALPMPAGINFSHQFNTKIDLPLDPLDWYALIKYSSGYIGEKMHPIIICLHNCVPFFSLDHYGILKYKFFFDDTASKIYQILKESDYIDLRVSLKKKCDPSLFTPTKIFQSIANFDIIKCQDFASKKYNEYEDMMKSILNTLTK